MDLAAFHKLRLAVQENARPADPRSALALQQTLQDSLLRSRLFAEVELGRTDDPRQLVIGVCRCRDQVLPWEAGMGIERLWTTAVAGASWEAHTVTCSENLMEFEGALTLAGSGQYLTVHLVAEPPATPAEQPADAGPEPAEHAQA